MWLNYQINGLSYFQLPVLKEECFVLAEGDREVKGKKPSPTLKNLRKGKIVPDSTEIHTVIYSEKLRRCGLK